jgi:hypothetical protein
MQTCALFLFGLLQDVGIILVLFIADAVEIFDE